MGTDDYYLVLKALDEHPESSQRGLSATLGLSLGKTHYLVRALAEKGWIKIDNFRRSDNKLSYGYALTPEGILQRWRLTREFLSRKEAEFEKLQVDIERLRQELDGSHPDTPSNC